MRALYWLLALLLAGCASAPSPPVMRAARVELGAFVLNGRIAVKHDDVRSSASVRWTHHVAEDEILLLAPFGQTMARIYRDAHGAELDASGKHYTAANAEELSQQVLGWYLPLDGMQYWVLARPAPGIKASVERDENGQVSAMRQDGWEIRYTRYAALTADSLPSRMSLQREDMEIQLLIDEWEK